MIDLGVDYPKPRFGRWIQSPGLHHHQGGRWSTDCQGRCRWFARDCSRTSGLSRRVGNRVKIAHGWNAPATWYVARAVLGVLGFDLRNPYSLNRQKAFIVPGVVPPALLDKLDQTPTWDEWDPDDDRWYYDWSEYASGDTP